MKTRNIREVKKKTKKVKTPSIEDVGDIVEATVNELVKACERIDRLEQEVKTLHDFIITGAEVERKQVGVDDSLEVEFTEDEKRFLIYVLNNGDFNYDLQDFHHIESILKKIDKSI